MATVRIKHHHRDYTCIQNSTLRDERLSYRARGILTMLLSYPDDWVINTNQIAKGSPKEGRDAISSAVKELMAYGYLVKRRYHDPVTGKFIWETELHELPALDEIGVEPLTENPVMDETAAVQGFSPSTEKPSMANPQPINGFTVNGSPIDGSPIDGKPGYLLSNEIRSIDLRSTDLPSTEEKKKEERAFSFSQEEKVLTAVGGSRADQQDFAPVEQAEAIEHARTVKQVPPPRLEASFPDGDEWVIRVPAAFVRANDQDRKLYRVRFRWRSSDVPPGSYNFRDTIDKGFIAYLQEFWLPGAGDAYKDATERSAKTWIEKREKEWVEAGYPLEDPGQEIFRQWRSYQEALSEGYSPAPAPSALAKKYTPEQIDRLNTHRRSIGGFSGYSLEGYWHLVEQDGFSREDVVDSQGRPLPEIKIPA